MCVSNVQLLQKGLPIIWENICWHPVEFSLEFFANTLFLFRNTNYFSYAKLKCYSLSTRLSVKRFIQ